MSADVQQIIALGIVALALIGLVARYRRQRKHPGCAAGCACPTKKIGR